MKNRLIKHNEYIVSENLSSLYIIKVYIYIRIIFMFLSFLIFITACIALFDIAKELQHIAYHLADGNCCALHF